MADVKKSASFNDMVKEQRSKNMRKQLTGDLYDEDVYDTYNRDMEVLKTALPKLRFLSEQLISIIEDLVKGDKENAEENLENYLNGDSGYVTDCADDLKDVIDDIVKLY